MYNFYAWSKGVPMQKEREKVDCYLKGKARDRKSLCDSWILKLKFKAIFAQDISLKCHWWRKKHDPLFRPTEVC